MPAQKLVEHRGFEPLTSTMRTLRATNCANAPRLGNKRSIAQVGGIRQEEFSQRGDFLAEFYPKRSVATAQTRVSSMCPPLPRRVKCFSLVRSSTWTFCAPMAVAFSAAMAEACWRAQSIASSKSSNSAKDWLL